MKIKLWKKKLFIYKVLNFLHCAEQNIQSSRIFARAECNRIFTLYIDAILNL
jgi:hypothetical protein